MHTLALTLREEGHNAEAERLFRETLDIQRRVLGSDHPDTLDSIELLAMVLAREGRYGEAETLYDEAVQRASKAQAKGLLGLAWYNFACGAAVAGHRDEALEYLRRAVDLGSEYALDMDTDNDLKSVHGDPRFTALVAHAKERAAAAQKK